MASVMTASCTFAMHSNSSSRCRSASRTCRRDKFIKIKVEIPDSDDDLMTMEDKHYLNMTSSNDVITEPCSSKKHLRETNEAQVTTDNSKAYLSERISVRNQKKKSTGIGKKKMQVYKNTLDNNEIFDRMNKKLICDDCGYIFLTKSSIIKHISSAHQSRNRISKTVQDIKPLVCTTCNKKFSHKHTLERHILTHTKNPNYKFIVNYGAKTEVQRKWKSDSKKYKCKYCDYSRDVKNPVTIHERKHTGEKPFQCSFCDYRSAQKSHITVHERIHTGEKPFACEFCDYKCVNRQGLKYHERRHTGSKPYKCNYCGFSFTQSSALIKHNRIHKGDKPFRCAFCDYRAADASSIKSHERIHTGNKLYKCAFCDYRSVQCSSVRTHEKNLHTSAIS